mmetsp:Transcript_107376/g.310331  ORF Transcript_107376/g.310331 Transcript_107376/m.310331 type:complete len:254 (+) Transcript_107376:764-1525(+)
MRTLMSPSKSCSHSCTTPSRKALCPNAPSIWRSSCIFSSSCSSIEASTALISLSRRLHSAISSRTFRSPFSMFVSMRRKDFALSMTCLRSPACFCSKSASCSRQACSRCFTLMRIASSSWLACLSALSCFSNCVAWFSSFSADKMPRKESNFASSTGFHSSLTSLLQCCCVNISTKAFAEGSFRATIDNAREGMADTSEELGARTFTDLSSLSFRMSFGSLSDNSPALASVCMTNKTPRTRLGLRRLPAGGPA